MRHLFHHYRGFAHTKRKDLARGKATVKALLYAYRVYLTGVHVLETGRIEANLPRLLDTHPLPGVHELIARKREGPEKEPMTGDEVAVHEPQLERLEMALVEAFKASKLPAEVQKKDALNDFVVRARLELGAKLRLQARG